MNEQVEWLPAVSAQLRALKAVARSRRLRFRLLELVCVRCGSLVGEVFETNPGPVLTYRQATILREPDDKREEFRLHLMVEGPDDAGGGWIPAGCTCARHMVRLHEVRTAITVGSKKVVLQPREREPEDQIERRIMKDLVSRRESLKRRGDRT